MQFNKSLLGIGLIAMSIGMVGCGENMDNSVSQQTRSGRNMGTQVKMNMKDNTNSMFSDGQYKATNRGRVLSSDRGSLLTTENTNDTTLQYGTQSNNAYDLARMQRIQQEVEKLQGYSDVTCVVNGNTAVVGCTQRNNNVSDTQTKNEITNIVKRCDPSIQRCEVISNKEGVERISKMAEDIRKGNIGTTISQDFTNMINDIIR